MDYVQILGLTAGALTTFSIVPEIRKVWQTKDVRDISITWLILVLMGVFLWTAYGVFVNSLPVIVWNGVTFVLICVLLAFDMKFSRKDKK